MRVTVKIPHKGAEGGWDGHHERDAESLQKLSGGVIGDPKTMEISCNDDDVSEASKIPQSAVVGKLQKGIWEILFVLAPKL